MLQTILEEILDFTKIKKIEKVCADEFCWSKVQWKGYFWGKLFSIIVFYIYKSWATDKNSFMTFGLGSSLKLLVANWKK